MKILFKNKDELLYLSTKKSFLALLVATTFLTGCQENSNLANESVQADSSITSETDTQFGTDPEATLVAKFEGQVKDSNSGEGISNVKVSVGDSVTTTDEEGRYAIPDVTSSVRAVVNFERDGYHLGSTIIQAKQFSDDGKTSPNYVEYAIDTYDYRWTYKSDDTVSGGNLAIASAVYTDAEGNVYDGNVSAELEYQDITTDEGKEIFPGSFEGKNINGETILFSSYGLITVALKDINGNTLNLSGDATATLTFPAVSSLEQQNIIPLWYYDYNQGIWIEDGYAELQTNGTYTGEISHFGTWSLNMPLETAPGIYRGRILYENGDTVKDARVIAIGPNWVRSDLSTDDEGVFEIEVLPGDDFKLIAYNYRYEYDAAYSAMIPALVSGEVVENN